MEEAILGLVTKSANDAAAAIGEMLGGDEDRFGQMMTLRARALGMSHSVFRNASGLPDPDQVTTARDLAVLAVISSTISPAITAISARRVSCSTGASSSITTACCRPIPGADGMKTG